MEIVTDFIFMASKIAVDGNDSHEIKTHLPLGRKAMTNPDSVLKSRDITLANKDSYSLSYGFSSSHVWMWELGRKDGWGPNNWYFQIVVGLQGDQPWIFIGRTNAEAPIIWPPDVKSRLFVKDPDAGKDWGQEEKEATKDEMAGWHHWLNGHEFEQGLGTGDG